MARDVQVPDEIAARLDALLSAFARDLAIAKAQTAAAKASDAPAFKATLPRVDAQAVVKDAADELGITCQYQEARSAKATNGAPDDASS